MSADGAWRTALDAAALAALDGAALGGVLVRARAGPVRTRFLDHLARLCRAPMLRIPAHVDDERLLGGIDLAATLRSGRRVAQSGLLAQADGGVLVAAMADRMSPVAAMRLGASLDSGEVRTDRDGLALIAPARFCLVALDEGADDDERAPAALAERLALHIDLNDLSHRDAPDPDYAHDIDAARARLAAMAPARDEDCEALVAAAAAFAIPSLRAPAFALRAARGLAALRGAEAIGEDDLVGAARLVLTSRARVIPRAEKSAQAEHDAPDEPPPPDQDATQAETLAERVVEAVAAIAPEDLLAAVARARSVRARTGAGGEQGGKARGRPAGVRTGALREARSLDVAATLRAAAPWQGVRRRDRPDFAGRVRVEPGDVRIRRRIQRVEQTAIFVVDASGSAALHRLGECKGAIEVLLSQAYVTRTRAALVAFRERGAQVLLSPTRSLARAKRALADLPGGGGTPIAAGLNAAIALALAERRGGRTPRLILMTDGRANVTRAGVGGRAEAEKEALEAAQAVRALGVEAALVDCAPRPRVEARALAEAMGARYAPLPAPSAHGIAAAADPAFAP
jgi:magnesium chelatase subunit D